MAPQAPLSIHGIFQARVLEWGAIAGENARSWEALGEARPGQSSLSAGALRYRAWSFADVFPYSPNSSLPLSKCERIHSIY